MDTLTKRVLAIVSALVVLAGAVTSLIDLLDGDGITKQQVTNAVAAVDETPTPQVTPSATVALGGDAGSANEATKVIPAPSTKDATAAAAGLADHEGLRYIGPDVLSSTTMNKYEDGIDVLVHHDQLPVVSPDAAPSFPGCVSKFVRNYSSRGGVSPHIITEHYTVSFNRPGWGDVWAIVNMFDQSRFAASSNFVIDGEGHCAYIVRDTDKAWAQAAANPYSVSIENVAYGTEGKLAPAQLKKNAQVVKKLEERWHIPNQVAAVNSACIPTRYGVLDHGALGACGGGHHDLRPFYGTSVVPLASQNAQAVAPIIRAVAALSVHKINAKDRARCKKVHDFRSKSAKYKDRFGHYQTARLKKTKTLGLKCVDGKAKRR